jgi:hypothetical protein
MMTDIKWPLSATPSASICGKIPNPRLGSWGLRLLRPYRQRPQRPGRRHVTAPSAAGSLWCSFDGALLVANLALSRVVPRHREGGSEPFEMTELCKGNPAHQCAARNI